ncbi:hypothetical protein PLESTB_000505900 [Pleodorina starrii]|uniref:EGF-like domain-containing protein n=1 Tax=Pleodorina starrii TaxID=330485 RepID=A0A9W6BG16_9CHLO|nr:hypothetical protein PLESTM_001770700 [Pleodorina starrii]GLC51469.1 hypothetical protein PLESTB_000505900 [Pleodorina starrii]GLC67712.1 hypothetical protein PLESTF_000597400 [Pleodorina starrii]
MNCCPRAQMSLLSLRLVTGGLLFLAVTSRTAFTARSSSYQPSDQAYGLSTRRSLANRVAVAGHRTTCHRSCSVHGVCNEELGRCDCPRHYTGPSCSDPARNISAICKAYSLTLHGDCEHDPSCFNNCNQRGKCITGMCHCEPGYWGMDCSISWGPGGKPQLLEGRYKPRKTGVKIYVYELPSQMTSWFGFWRMDRPLHLVFWQRIMSSGIRTLNGDEADYFFIPLNTRGSVVGGQLSEAISYIRRTWPWWNNTDYGHRHFMIHTGDIGVNEYPNRVRKEMSEAMANITWLTHWGLYEEHPTYKWDAAHRPGKDLVVPPVIMSQGFQESPMNLAVQAEADAKGESLERKHTLFFAGRICGDRQPPDEKTGLCKTTTHHGYSLGVRQKVHQYYRNYKGFKIVEWTKTYLEDISTHKFCLAPVGGGWGKRALLVTFMGCVPVCISDKVLQAFEPEIDWSKFSVSVAEADISNLPRILNSISSAELASKQKRLRCAAQHMFYSSSLGAILGEDGRYDAFETTMEILRVRKEHPGVPPEKYTKVDERFRKFVDCDLDGPDPLPLCTQGHDRQFPDRPACSECRNKESHSTRFYTSPGGLLCCAVGDMAQCPRAWP